MNIAQVDSMSDIQLYLFEVDKNKKEATSIAEQTAKRKDSDFALEQITSCSFVMQGYNQRSSRWRIGLYHLENTLTMARLQSGSKVIHLEQALKIYANSWLAMSYVAEVLQAVPPKVLSGHHSKIIQFRNYDA